MAQPVSRRNLLTSSAAAVASIAAASALPTLAAVQDAASPASTPAPGGAQKLKIGMIGIGGQGHWRMTQVLPI